MTNRSFRGKWKRLNMGWKAFIGFQVRKMVLMVLVFGSLLLEDWDRFFSDIAFVVIDGFSIIFWHHRWCDGVLLRNCFFCLYAVAADRDKHGYVRL